MERRIKLSVLTFLAFVFVIGLASPLSFDISGETYKNAVHGSSVSGSFIINNTNSSINFTQVNITSITPNFTIATPSGFSLNYSEVRSVSYSISIPKYLSKGEYTFKFNISAGNGTTTVSPEIGSITVNVSDSPSLSVSSLKVYDNTNQTNIPVTNNGNRALSVTLSVASSTEVSFSVPSPTQIINPGESKNFLVNIDSSKMGSRLNSISHTITASATEVSATGTLTVDKSYCRYGIVGDLVRITDVEDRSSGDDWEWEPLKDVRVRVEVENRADSRKSITVKLGLYDSDGRSVWLSKDEKELDQTIRISDHDDAIFNFEFTLPADLSRNKDYRLYIKAYDKESEQCANTYETIDLDTDKEVIADNFDLPTVLFCGSTNQISFRVHNLDLGDEEIMRARVYNKELGIDLVSEQFELDNGDNEYVYFNLVIPEGKQSKSYKLTFYADYDYRESSDAFRSSEDIGSFTVRLEGDRCKSVPLSTIIANLDKDTKTGVGRNLSVKLLITNPSDIASFQVLLEGYDSWASSAVLDTPSFNLQKDGTREVTATFVPTKAGRQEFTVRTIVNGRITEPQTVSVDVGSSESIFSKTFSNIRENLPFYLTVSIFVILILIILVLLIRFINSN